MPYSSDTTKRLTNDPDLKEIRDIFEDDSNAWEDIRQESRTDMRYLAGDPWEEKDKRARKDAGRPCISLDELNQYTNQTINNIRQNKRDGQLIPEGMGANDDDARLRENAIRGIEYKWNAPQAYLTALQNAVERSYGFARILTRLNSKSKLNEQDIVIKRVPNPDTILIDPDYQESDGSDMRRAFVLDLLTKNEFRGRFGKKAKFLTFGPELMRMAPNWIRRQHVQVCEYWKRKGNKVTQQIVNGVEILEENDWPGSWIPILCCFGKELFVDDGSGPRRILLSQVRLARDPQMLLAYLCSQECEEAGMSPKTPFVGYKGQFESDSEAWEYLNKVGRAYVQADIVTDGSNQVLPLPTRPQFIPNFQAYEIAKESARRSIQAAMGITPLPTAAQRMNEKSGVALERIQGQEALGSYHFVDNYDGLLRHSWRILNELLDEVYDTSRDVPIVKQDGTKASMRVNDPEWAEANPDEDHLTLGADSGQYGATVVIGPSVQSEREAVSDFVDQLLPVLPSLGLPPQITAKVLSKAIIMRNLGAAGKDLAETISPPDDGQVPPQAQAAIAQSQAQLAQATGIVAQLQLEKKAKVIEGQTKERIAAADMAVRMTEADKDRETRIAVAEITTKAQVLSERVAALESLMQQMHAQAHELGMAAVAHKNAQEMAQQQAMNPQPVNGAAQ